MIRLDKFDLIISHTSYLDQAVEHSPLGQTLVGSQLVLHMPAEEGSRRPVGVARILGLVDILDWMVDQRIPC